MPLTHEDSSTDFLDELLLSEVGCIKRIDVIEGFRCKRDKSAPLVTLNLLNISIRKLNIPPNNRTPQTLPRFCHCFLASSKGISNMARMSPCHDLAFLMKPHHLGKCFINGKKSTKKAPGTVACLRPSAPVVESLMYGSFSDSIASPNVVDKETDPTIL